MGLELDRKTRAPCSTEASATANPIPEVPPRMRMFFSDSLLRYFEGMVELDQMLRGDTDVWRMTFLFEPAGIYKGSLSEGEPMTLHMYSDNLTVSASLSASFYESQLTDGGILCKNRRPLTKQLR